MRLSLIVCLVAAFSTTYAAESGVIVDGKKFVLFKDGKAVEGNVTEAEKLSKREPAQSSRDFIQGVPRPRAIWYTNNGEVTCFSLADHNSMALSCVKN